ncbi:carbohydrate ABC transporter permease [Ideonella livida]|uniref:Carbohydrate ABC transporter permease n=1 Tax=Ideonella livida TaxID=2707176 RepID=A0A7C9PHH2_9BURK|nr:carbohydrate ABC transporter permease [Ideonella livida]NDY91849.1 carbohydrate ABC transporter permease [Ideonella livida]
MNPTPHIAAARRARLSRWLGVATWYATGALLLLFFLFPLAFMAVSAFKTDEAQLLRDMAGFDAFRLHGTVGWDNFTQVLGQTNFLRALGNSTLVVGLTVVAGVFVNSALAYALARLQFPGRGLLVSAIVALIIVPFEAIAVPLLLLVNQLPWWGGQVGWLDSYQVQVIPFIAHAFSVFLFYQFFIALPRDLEEAARMDGAGPLRIYWSIVLPLSKPVIATVVILQFLARWGDLLWPVMVVRGPVFETLPLAMQTFFGQFPRQWGPVMAFAVMTTLPTLLVFIVFQRWFVKSAISSGIKG